MSKLVVTIREKVEGSRQGFFEKYLFRQFEFVLQGRGQSVLSLSTQK